MIALFASTSALLKMVYSSLLASIGVAIVFSLVVYGAMRSSEARRTGRASAAAAFGALSTVAFLAFLAAVAYGLFLVGHKG